MFIFSGIYLKEITFDKVGQAADLYYAAEKYDIGDIRNISKKFMLDNCHVGNMYYLLSKAKLFNFPDLEMKCKAIFMEQTYEALTVCLLGRNNYKVLSEFFSLENLSILSCEYELYLTLETMVQSKKLLDYSNSLSKIRFLTMETKDILTCDLLTDKEKVRVVGNIEVLKHRETAVLSMPLHLSTKTNARKRQL